VQPSLTPGDDVSGPWYELGGLYAAAGEDARKATSEGFVVAFVAAAQVLLSAPLFGTSWAGPFAALIPPTAGCSLVAALCGGGARSSPNDAKRCAGSSPYEARTRTGRQREDSAPTTTLNSSCCAASTSLLRSRRTTRALLSARLLETSFGFTPEDGFECGPLNVVPDMPKMKALRERWEARLSARRTLQEAPPPSLGLGEDVRHRVFPREMTVSAELAMRGAYLEISCKLLRESYGERPETASEEIRHRAKRDLEEYAAITGRRAR